MQHDPSEYIRGLQQILVSDKKHIGFLFGAGSSLANKPCKVPAIGEMTNLISQAIISKGGGIASAFQEIIEEISRPNRNIEKILSHIEQKIDVVGNGKLNGISKSEFESIATLIKDEIKALVSVHQNLSESDKRSLIHTRFGEWIKRADRKQAIEIFTTNYDYLFEIGLERCAVPYYDGFSGSYEPFFSSESVEDTSIYPKITKLWKIHGSLGWGYDSELKRVIRKQMTQNSILIYPSHLKYHDSKKQPYISLIDRIGEFLKQPDSVLVTCGYSFGDEHINERIVSALRRGSNSHVIALIYDELTTKNEAGKDNKSYALAESNSLIWKAATECSKISAYGMRGAIIGGIYGEWKLKTEPSTDSTNDLNRYFEEDGPEYVKNVGEGGKGDEIWTGKGRFTLPDFSQLTALLSGMMAANFRPHEANHV